MKLVFVLYWVYFPIYLLYFLSNETKLINNPKISQLKTSCLSYMLVLRNTNPLYNLLSSIIHNLPFICFNFYIKQSKLKKKKKNQNTWHTYHDWWKKKMEHKKWYKIFYSISNNINQQFYNALNIFDYKFTIKRNNLK